MNIEVKESAVIGMYKSLRLAPAFSTVFGVDKLPIYLVDTGKEPKLASFCVLGQLGV